MKTDISFINKLIRKEIALKRDLKTFEKKKPKRKYVHRTFDRSDSQEEEARSIFEKPRK